MLQRLLTKRLSKLKIALVHDVFLSDGGSERVFLIIAKMFPQADLYTYLACNDSAIYRSLKSRIKRKVEIPHWFVRYANKLKLFAYWFWERLDFVEYDLVITSSHSYSSKNIVTRGRTLHICYCHTPPRYLYPNLTPEGNSTSLEKVFFQNCLKYHLLKLEKMSGKRPRVMLANSQTVAERIEYFYHRHANVIYPPVESPPQKIQKYRHKTKYYFYCGRLVRQKFVNLAIQACKKLNKTLIVAGDGDALTDLKRISDKNIIFTGRVSERKKWSLLKGAEAFIFPTPDEDFGIAPVEALMVGTPVIAFKSGGPSETLVDGQTGVFFHPFSVSGLIEGIKKFESLKFSRRLCRLRAQKYSRIKFEKKLKKVVYGALNAQQLRKIP